MNVLLVNGSPHREGCTHTALCTVSGALRQNGIGTDLFWIGTKPLSGCLACHRCDTLNQCVLHFWPWPGRMTALSSALRSTGAAPAGPSLLFWTGPFTPT